MLNTTRTKMETIAAASISIVNIEFVGCGGSTGGFAAGAFDTRGTGLAEGWPAAADSVDKECDCPFDDEGAGIPS